MNNKINNKALEELNINLDKIQMETFNKYMQFFLEKNSQLNLISQNDAKFLFEKHIFDSLAINKFLTPKSGESLLDIGTGGGFPAVPIAILYENLNVYPIDSIRKKINVIEDIKKELNIDNLFPLCNRVENINEKYNYVTTRAVSKLDTILKYAIPKLKKRGLFFAYKSKKSDDELKDAQKTMKLLNAKVVDVIRYKLPLQEIYERNIIIFSKS